LAAVAWAPPVTIEDLGRAVVGDEVAVSSSAALAPRSRRTEALLTKRITSDLPSYSSRSASPSIHSSGASRFCRKVACCDADRSPPRCVAVRATRDLDPLRPDDHRPLGDDDVAVEDEDLVQQVARARVVGLDRQSLNRSAFSAWSEGSPGRAGCPKQGSGREATSRHEEAVWRVRFRIAA
jgi:hypothetical protein